MSVVIDGTTGITTPGLTNTGTETLVNLTTTGNTTLGDASTDTLNVGNGGLIKDASGNVGINQSSPAGKLHVVGATNNWTQVVAGSTTSTQSYGLRIQAGTTSADTSFLIRDATNATDYLTVTGNGNVGVGNSAPSAKLQVDASNFALATSYSTLSSNFAVRTTTTQAANVGGEIALGGYTNGTSSPCDFARIHGKKENGTAGNVSGYLAFEVSYDGGPSPYIFERARIDSSGNLLVGTSSSSGGGGSSGKVVVLFNGATGNGIDIDDTRTSAGTDTATIFIRGTTAVGRLDTTLTTLALTNLSDQRVKTNIENSGNTLSLINSLKVRQFDWTIDQTHEDFGFVAQELNEVLPQAVSMGKTEEEMWGVNYIKLVPILTKAIQEQTALITTLTDRITALEAK